MNCKRCGKEMKHIEGLGWYCPDFSCKKPKREVKVPHFETEGERIYYLRHYRY